MSSPSDHYIPWKDIKKPLLNIGKRPLTRSKNNIGKDAGREGLVEGQILWLLEVLYPINKPKLEVTYENMITSLKQDPMAGECHRILKYALTTSLEVPPAREAKSVSLFF